MNAKEIAPARLQNQRLLGRSFRQPADVVRYLGAVQAQDYAGAKWAVGLRTHDIADGDVERAFDEGRILRAHVMRPTWHFVAPEDILWLQSLTAPRVHAVNGTMYRQTGLDAAALRRGNRVIARALRGQNYLTRAELSTALERDGISTKGTVRLAYLMHHAELDGIICSGPRRGKQFTYGLVEERAPQARALARENALIELARRYFLSRGPATVPDFSWWSGLTQADARQAIEMLGSAIEQSTVDERTYWHMPAAIAIRAREPSAHLLPNYDEYFIGFKDRSAILLDLMKDRRAAQLPPINTHIVIFNGQVVGGWRRSLKKDSVVVEIDLRMRLSRAAFEALAAASERYGEFLGLPVKLIVRPATKRK